MRLLFSIGTHPELFNFPNNISPNGYPIPMENKEIIIINQNNKLLAFELQTPISQSEMFELSMQLLSTPKEYTKLTFSKLGIEVIPLKIVSEIVIN